jgi:hypothetical protein
VLWWRFGEVNTAWYNQGVTIIGYKQSLRETSEGKMALQKIVNQLTQKAVLEAEGMHEILMNIQEVIIERNAALVSNATGYVRFRL